MGQLGLVEVGIDTLDAQVVGEGGWLHGGGLGRGAGREGILKDAEAAPGLRELARRVELCEALQISVAEWSSLRSLETEVSLAMEGYVALLMLIRGYRIER